MLNYADILLQDIARHIRQNIYLFYTHPRPSYALNETGLSFVAKTARISR